MDTSTRSRKITLLSLRLLVVLLILVTAYLLTVLHDTAKRYDSVSAMISAQPTFAEKTRIGDKDLVVPTYEMFHPGHIWALVSKKRPLSGEAGYSLVDIPVSHGDAALPMKVARDIAPDLERLVNAAEAAGEPLMVSSAYRSLSNQREIYNEFVAKNGKDLAALYVSPVGASEHHTGLSVDLSSLSDECADDSDACSLSQSAAAWLAKNASRFGFIQRYPQGEQAITGVGYEPWHYRFVGVPLASAMATTDLTFDEVVELIAPGYAR